MKIKKGKDTMEKTARKIPNAIHIYVPIPYAKDYK